MENQLKIQFSEVIYTSSQKSMVSGMSGFGVRTHSADIESGLLDIMMEKDIFGYAISTDKMVSLSQLQDNPTIVYDYPRTFIYKKITTDNGELQYIFARTVYIGIDYGYFCGGGATRAGSNYFTHALIFKSEPPREIFNLLLTNNYFENNVFLPLDYTCSPDNKELTKLLTGEPHIIAANSFFINPQPAYFSEIEPYMADVIKGVLQLTLANRDNDAKRHLIVKAPDSITENIVGTLKLFLPAPIVQPLTFATNYTKDGVPDDYDIVFVNENYTGTLYEEDHICVDLLDGKHIGIFNNCIYDKITEFVLAGENQNLSGLLDYITNLNLKESTDYDFLMNIFILTKTDNDVRLADLTPDFISKLSNTGLAGDDKLIVWNKINVTLNEGLQSTEGKDIIGSLTVIKNISDCGRGNEINISDESRAILTHVLFDSSKYFNKIVKPDLLQLIVKLILPASISSADNLFASLQTTKDNKYWSAFINLYYSTKDKNFNANSIISQIADSQLETSAKYELLITLFPYSEGGGQLFYDYFLLNPDSMSKLTGILEDICLKNKTGECFTSLINKVINNEKSLKSISPLVEKFYIQKLTKGDDYISVMDGVVKLITTITPDVFDKLQAHSLLKELVNYFYKHPKNTAKESLEALLATNVHMDEKTATLYKTALEIMQNQLPETVTSDIMIMSYKLRKNNLLEKLFDNWLKNGLDKADLLRFIQQSEDLSKSPELIEHMLTQIWNSNDLYTKENKEKLVETIIYNAKWNKNDYNNFIKSNSTDSLVLFITKSTGFINRIFNKFFGRK